MGKLGFVILLVVALLTTNFLAGCTGPSTLTAEWHLEQGNRLVAQGHLEEAISEYDEAIRLNPEYAYAYYNRGTAYYYLGQLERGIQDYDEAIRLNPEDALAYANRAQVYTLLNRDTEVEKDINRAIELGVDPSILKMEIERLKQQR